MVLHFQQQYHLIEFFEDRNSCNVSKVNFVISNEKRTQTQWKRSDFGDVQQTQRPAACVGTPLKQTVHTGVHP